MIFEWKRTKLIGNLKLEMAIIGGRKKSLIMQLVEISLNEKPRVIDNITLSRDEIIEMTEKSGLGNFGVHFWNSCICKENALSVDQRLEFGVWLKRTCENIVDLMSTVADYFEDLQEIYQQDDKKEEVEQDEVQ